MMAMEWEAREAGEEIILTGVAFFRLNHPTSFIRIYLMDYCIADRHLLRPGTVETCSSPAEVRETKISQLMRSFF